MKTKELRYLMRMELESVTRNVTDRLPYTSVRTTVRKVGFHTYIDIDIVDNNNTFIHHYVTITNTEAIILKRGDNMLQVSEEHNYVSKLTMSDENIVRLLKIKITAQV